MLEEPELTPDGLVLLLCHELGHHYGGYPFQKGDRLTAAEGSADFFATRVCGPALLGSSQGQFVGPKEHPPNVVDDTRCARSEDRELCNRLLAAALSVTRALHVHFREAPDAIPPYEDGSSGPSLDASDEFHVERTVAAHYPSLQCRLDTLVRGALCGLASDRALGTPVPAETEDDALAQSCSVDSFEPGARPECWFREGSIPTRSTDPPEVVWKGSF